MLNCLRFSKSGKDDTLVQEAAQAVRSASGAEPVWVGEWVESDVDKECVCVLESFDSPGYSLLEGKCRVIGPAVVLAHLKHGWPLPASTQPVFSMAMHGVVACFTQAGNKERREKLTQLVKLMGGRVEGDFTKRVTHLIAGHVGSTKYHVARKLHLPILLPSWVESCWNDGLRQVIYATQPPTLTPHQAPPFTGCTITVTGLDEKTRLKVKEVCLKNGGSYSGELTKDVCTHLLVGNKSSTKFKYARQWKMYCVTPQWFHDSVDSGYCMPESDYDVDGVPGGGVSGVGRGREDKANEWKKNLENFKLPTVADDEFLDGCRIFLSGFTENELMVLYKIINLGGGVRFSRLSEDVSHVVLGEKEQSVVSGVKELKSSLHVVSAQWLMDCCTKGERVSEDGYVCLDKEPGKNEETGSSTAGRKRKLAAEDDKLSSNDNSKRPRYDVTDGDEQLDEEDLMNQYKMDELPSEAPPTGDGVLNGQSLSVSRLFSVDDCKIARQVVSAHGGKLVSPPNGSYHLLPLEVSGVTVVKTGATHVTMIWLQRCIEANSLLDPSSYFLFTPLTTPISESSLSDCVLAFSQFSDIEREHLVRFSKGLGAIVQDHFARYPAHGLLATTHLILKYPSGDKYSFAHKWGIPALADSWIFACAKAQKIVPVDAHLMSLSESAPPTSAPSLPTSSAAPPTSSSDNAQTSHKPDQTVPDNTRDKVSKALPAINNVKDHNSDTDGTGMESEVELESGLEVKKSKSVLSGVVIALSKKLGSQEAQLRSLALSMGAELRRRVDQKCTHFIYQGKATEALRDRDVKLAKEHDCFIVSPHWITTCSERGVRVEESDYPHTYNPNMALTGISMPKHPLSQSQHQPPPPSSRIPPAPVHSDTIAPTTSTDIEHRNETSSDDGTEPEDMEYGNETGDIKTGSSEAAKRLQEHLEHIKEVPREQQRRRRSRRLINKEDKPNNPPPPSHKSHPHRSPDKKGLGRRDRRGRRKEEQMLDSQVSDSQLLQVTYDDPKGRREKEKLLARIEREAELKARGLDPKASNEDDHHNIKSHDQMSASTDINSDTRHRGPETTRLKPLKDSNQGDRHLEGPLIDRDLPSSTPAAPSLNVPIVTHATRGREVTRLFDEKNTTSRTRKQSPPRFLLSSLDQREKVDYGALIQELGGQYIDQDYFTTKCTHLVVGKASRTEKYLGACAAGKWVLHKSYLEECRASHTFVGEESHEWGVASSRGGEVPPLEAAPRTWRLALAEKRRKNHSDKDGGGAFNGWKVLLFAERNKLPGLKRLLEAGGANVLSKITIPGLKDVTHAFINMNYFPKESLSLEQLVRNNIHCLKPDFIAEHLSKGSALQMESLYINEVKPLIQRNR